MFSDLDGLLISFILQCSSSILTWFIRQSIPHLWSYRYLMNPLEEGILYFVGLPVVEEIINKILTQQMGSFIPSHTAGNLLSILWRLYVCQSQNFYNLPFFHGVLNVSARSSLQTQRLAYQWYSIHDHSAAWNIVFDGWGYSEVKSLKLISWWYHDHWSLLPYKKAVKLFCSQIIQTL